MFKNLKQKMQKRFDELVKTGTLYYVNVDRDKIWEVYLSGFAPEKKQENTCNCCKAFLRQFGGIVAITSDLKRISLWDFEAEDEEYNQSIIELRKYIASLEIKGIFLNSFAKLGTDSNVAPSGTRWHHFYVELPSKFVAKELLIGSKEGASRDSRNVFERSLNEITDEALDTALELIAANSMYRANESKGVLEAFQKLKNEYKKLKTREEKSNFCWVRSASAGDALSRIKNSAMGTFLMDISENKPLEDAVRAFERIMAPASYKRPTAIVTPKMIQNAQARLVELDMIDCLDRRYLTLADLSIKDVLFKHQNSQLAGDVFAQLTNDVTINPKTFERVEEISITDFIDKIVPTAKSIKVLVENSHLDNFVSLIGPKEKNDKKFLKWDNNVTWVYSGNVADSVKTRVKAAGGKVDGVLRVSLSWNRYDDLDLSVIEPRKYQIYYGNRDRISPSGGRLDVDMNAGYGSSLTPVENIAWTHYPTQEGTFKVQVNQYRKDSKRDGTDGFSVEIEYEGELWNFHVPNNGSTGKLHEICEFNFSKNKGLNIIGKSSTTTNYPSTDKWGVKTGQFVKVNAITYSPNYWGENAVGNRHYLFLLDKCKSDETMRTFLNEQLNQEFDKDRKVFELLGEKLKIEPSDDQLAGLGFADSAKNNTLIVQVEGTIKRNLRIKF